MEREITDPVKILIIYLFKERHSHPEMQTISVISLVRHEFLINRVSDAWK